MTMTMTITITTTIAITTIITEDISKLTLTSLQWSSYYCSVNCNMSTYLSLTDLIALMFENKTCDWPRSKTHRDEPADNSSELIKCDISILRLLK